MKRAWLGLAALWAASGLANAQNAPVSINVDAGANRHPINPQIYGVAFATSSELSDLNCPLNRSGGNATSQYNWSLNASNRGSDWYFESLAETSAVSGELGDTFIADSRAGGAQAMLTIPMIGWVAKLGPNRGRLSSFSIAKYGAQQDADWQWFPDAGNGVLTNGAFVANDPNDANVPADASFQLGWVQHLVSRWGTAANGGLRFYLLDNEHSIWFATHRDVHPVGPTMEEIRDKILQYSAMIKGADASAKVLGPEEWGWSGYLLSGYDQQWGGQHGWNNLPDRTAHGNMDYLPWLLDQLRQREPAGQRAIDFFSVHYYPQGGEFSEDTSNATQLLRNRSTRSLWDPGYVDESWIGDTVKLIPRLRSWAQTYYHADTPIGITEYNWGAEGHINGATTQADILGIFGREGLDLATRWTTPDASSPTYQAIKIYRNYDGQKSTFGDTSVSATGGNPDQLAVFAALRGSDGALTIMIVSKVLSGATPVNVQLAGFGAGAAAQAWQLTAGTTVHRLSPDVAVASGALSATVPAQSVTLLVLPASGSATPTATPRPTPTFSATATATTRPTFTATPRSSATFTATATARPTATATATARPTATATATASPTPTATAPPTPTFPTDWLQFNVNSQHSGSNPLETTITKANVASLHARYHVALPGIADGAPAFLRGVTTAQGVKDLLFVNTKAGRIVALDAATGATIWSKQPATGPNYTTSSPAIDPNRQFVYAYGLDGKVHKYQVGDGSEILSGWPQLATLKPNVEKGSSALSIAVTGGGTFLYVANGGYPGDAGDYQGHVTTINLASGTQSVFNANCSNLTCHLAENGSGDCSQAKPDCSHVQTAVWARAGVVYSSGLDRVFFATGNGDFDASSGGKDWGDSVIAIRPDGTGTGGGLPVDSYTPTEFQQLQNADADLGSTSPAVLPAVPGSRIASLGVQSQKVLTTAKIRLLNLANLSGAGAPGHVGGEIQKIDVPQGGGVLTAPAIWKNPADNSVWIFYANGSGISGLSVAVDASGNPSLAVRWSHGPAGSSPIVAGGILYYAGPSGLTALDPVTGAQLWTSGGTIGGIHWESPIVVNGRLYVTDEGSQLWAFEPSAPTPTPGPTATATSTATPRPAATFGPTAPPGHRDNSDLNADGQSDVVLQYSDGSVGVWYMNGSKVSAGQYVLNKPLSGWTVRGVGDFNGDGSPDLVLQYTDGSVGVWLMNRSTIVSGTYIRQQPVPGWTVTGVADFNGDGWPDILLQYQDGSVGVWLMNGTRMVSGLYVEAQPLPGWTVRGTGDFNGDHRPDILLQYKDGSIATWLMNGTTITSGVYISTTPLSGWTPVGTGDFNGDGQTDLLLQYQDGSVGVWYLNGTHVTAGAYIYRQPLPGWKVATAR